MTIFYISLIITAMLLLIVYSPFFLSYILWKDESRHFLSYTQNMDDKVTVVTQVHRITKKKRLICESSVVGRVVLSKAGAAVFKQLMEYDKLIQQKKV